MGGLFLPGTLPSRIVAGVLPQGGEAQDRLGTYDFLECHNISQRFVLFRTAGTVFALNSATRVCVPKSIRVIRLFHTSISVDGFTLNSM